MSQGNQDYQANAGVEDVPGTSRDMGHASRDIHESHIQNVIMGDNISIHQSDVREESGDKASKIPKLQDLDDPVHLSHEFYIDRQEPLSTHSAVYQGIRKSDAMGPVTVAIKQIPINIQEDAGTLLNEAKSIIGINHRNVIKYIHADYCKGTFSSMYLAMELCLSENMHDRVVRMRRSNRRFTRPDCMSVAKQLAAGLKAVHDKNLLHRDIKPSNVLISLDRKCIKLTDFSLAKPKLPDRSVTADSSKRIGTDGWRAPGVLKQNSHRFESDIFSLGLVFYFVWSNGDHAFGQDADLTNANIKNNKNRNLQKIQFPEAEMAETLLTKMLEYDARRRISAVDLCSDPLLVVATDELENLDGCPCSGVAEPEIAPLTGESIILFSKTSSLMHAYIPSRNVWEHRQPLSQDIVSWEMTVVALGEYIYTLLQNQRVYRIKYNDPNAHWEQQKNTVYDHGGMPSAAVLESRIYVIGGSQWSTKITKEGEVYEPNDNGGTWSKIPDMTTSRKVHSLVSCKGCIYSIGGWERIGAEEEGAVAKCEKFDPNAGGHGSWSSIPSMHKIRYATATVAHDEKIYVLGGWREGCRLTEAECYDVNRNTWTILKDMSTGRSFFSAVAVGGRVYAIDGDDVAPQTIEEYDPEQKEWKMVAKLDNMQIWPKGAVSAVLKPEPTMEGTSR